MINGLINVSPTTSLNTVNLTARPCTDPDYLSGMKVYVIPKNPLYTPADLILAGDLVEETAAGSGLVKKLTPGGVPVGVVASDFGNALVNMTQQDFSIAVYTKGDFVKAAIGNIADLTTVPSNYVVGTNILTIN